MGMFDTIHCRCPACGAKLEAQTKLGECILLDLGIGDKFPMTVVMRDSCPNGHQVMVIVNNGVIVGFGLPINDTPIEEGGGHIRYNTDGGQ